MVKRCLDDGQYKQALGLGLEARRMDIFKNSITSCVSIITLKKLMFLVNLFIIKFLFRMMWQECWLIR